MSITISEAQKRSFDVLISSAAFVLAIIAGGITYYEYLDSAERARVGHTMQTLGRFFYGRNSEDQTRVDQALNRVESEFKAKLRSQVDLDSKSRSMLADQITVSTIDGDHELAEAVDRLWNFYAEAAVCAERGECSESYTRDAVGTDALNFFVFVHPYICVQKKRHNEPQPVVDPEKFFNSPRQGC
jgi:hypothetical protein